MNWSVPNLVTRDMCCVSIQGLHPSKDSAFVVFEGESFRETLLTSSAVWSISWLRHQIFYPYVMISAAQVRESDDLRYVMSPFSLFLSSFSGAQRILAFEGCRPWIKMRQWCANLWHGDVMWCHKVTELKAGPLTRRFRSRVFCGREELLLVLTLTSLTSNIHKNNTTHEDKTNTFSLTPSKFLRLGHQRKKEMDR